MLEDFSLIKQGAEARIYKGVYLGKQAIAKQRFVKTYRNPDLDSALTRERMKAECRAIVKCKSVGISTPCLYLVDFRRRLIMMEYIDNNVTVKDFIEQSSKEQRDIMAHKIGKIIGKMHTNGIIHGDLTTSNILITSKTNHTPGNLENCKIFIIDFGLSHTGSNSGSSVEEKGVDLYVLEKALLSTHSTAEEIFPIMLEGYQEDNKQSQQVLKKLEEVRARGRKRTMVG